MPTQVVPAGRAGTLHWPKELSPNATTVPFDRRASECVSPAAIST